MDMNILLVEDNDLDVEILKRSLKKVGGCASLVRAVDGMDALEILKNDAKNPVLSRPFVVFLDINMPRMNGHEFLEELRKTEEIKRSIVYVFTTSDSKKDVARAYQNCANGYIVKPSGPSELQNVLKAVQAYWSICEHPD